MNKVYIVYDGRAKHDVENASILECISHVKRGEAIAEFHDMWGDEDAVLYEYDDDNGNLINGELVK